MQLNINQDRLIDDVTATQIQELLPRVGLDQFAILSRADEHYMQFYRSDEGYQLEYREGSYDKHYEADTEGMAIESIVAAFVGFLADDPAQWKEALPWTKVDFSEDFEGDEDLTHYQLDGGEYARIRVGSEREPTAGENGGCSECDRPNGDFHEAGCSREECPRCHEVLVECSCQ